MDVGKVLIQYDNMFDVESLEDIEAFLVQKIDEAYKEEDYYSAITLLNEIIGFCRDTSQGEKADKYSNQVLDLMTAQGINGTVEYATTLLNIANAYRAFGKLDKSLKLYENVEQIYNEKLDKDAFNYASLYNNWSLLYQELGDFVNAAKMLQQALYIVDSYPKAIMEQATTRTNMAVTLLRLSKSEKDEASSEKVYNTAMKYLEQALAIYEEDGGRDFHYSAALSAMGDALYYRNKFNEAADYYGRAMEETEKHVGKTDAYYRIQDNYEKAIHGVELENYNQIMGNNNHTDDKDNANNNTNIHKMALNRRNFKNNMERCLAFYREYGVPMIHNKFADYESRIAVGLIGEGSDCMEYDDDISKDHDYNVGFCMWLTEEIYNEIGDELQAEYNNLIINYSGEFYKKDNNDMNLCDRRGVFCIGDFYDTLLDSSGFYDKLVGLAGYGQYSLSEPMWLKLSEERIAMAVNGRVFKDDLGEFTRVRNALKEYYPNKVTMLKLAQYIHEFSQAGQYNYVRMMARHDYTTANICRAKAVDMAMHIIYLLNARFAPYYKWLRRGLDDVEILGKAVKILDEISELPIQKEAWTNTNYSPYMINVADVVATKFEEVAVMILDELNARDIVVKKDTFLDSYAEKIAALAYDEQDMEEEKIERKVRVKVSDIKESRISKVASELIEEIILREWNQFDKVDNEGGRADCQDDWNTFSIMRRSQYMTWTEELLSSYRNDLAEADSKGWNMITEKYARMMESTAPDKYMELKANLPVRSPERIAIQEEIIKIQIGWMEEFAVKYPNMASNSRSIHTYEDTVYNTSYETYLRGELGTYSDDTLVLYGRFIAKVNQEGKNLAYMIMNNTAMLYGYSSVEEAESKINE